MHTIYQGYYDELSRQHIDPMAVGVDITFNRDHPLCEYNIYKTFLQNGTFDLDKGPVGLISSKFKIKTTLELTAFSQYCAWAFGKGADVVFVNPMIGAEAIYQNVWETDDMYPTFKALFSIQDVQALSLMSKSVYANCNYFVGNAKFWPRYIAFCDGILAKIESLKETDPFTYSVIYNSMGYKRRLELDYRPFIIERLFSSFLLLNRDIVAAGLECAESVYITKFGAKAGSHLYEMSKIKNTAIYNRDINLLKQWHEIRQPILKDARAIWEHDDPVYSYYDAIVDYVGHALP